MDQESGCHSQSEHREAANKPRPQTPSITATPPRLTPHPSLLDPHTLTPTTSSSPPPLTPAPKLTSTTGSTPKLPSPTGPIPKLTSPIGPTPSKLTSPIGPTPSKLTSPIGPIPKLTSPIGPTPSKLTSTSPTPSKLTSPIGPIPKLTSPIGPTPSKLTSTSPTPSKLTSTSPTPSKLTSTSPTPSKLTSTSPTPSKLTSTSPTPSKLTSPIGPTPSKLTSPIGPTPSKLTSPIGPTPSKLTSPIGPTPSKLTSPIGPTPSKLTSPIGPTPSKLTCPIGPTPSKLTPPIGPTPSKLTPPTGPILKLPSTIGPVARTYARPILPSPPGPAASSSTHSPPLSGTQTVSKTPSLTNGSPRPAATATTTSITPFHTPASPPGRQVPQAVPAGSPVPGRANQSPSLARQRVSQQALLLGKSLKGSGQDQVLLRAQMLILTSAMRPAQPSTSSSGSSPSSSSPASAQLQSLTLRTPSPRAVAIPPTLRLKPSAPPPLSRPHTPLFPPLRPRPSPGTTSTEAQGTASRHLSVPPPTLYSPVRAIPLRSRHPFPNGHRAAPPRQSVAPPISRLPAGPISCSVTQNQSQPSTSPFNRSSSAARQLQIIALSSGRQAIPGTYVHTSVGPPDLLGDSKQSLCGGEALSLPLNPSLPKTASALPSPNTPPGQTAVLSQRGTAFSEELRGQAVPDRGGDLTIDETEQKEPTEEEMMRTSSEGMDVSKENEMETTKEIQNEMMEEVQEGKETPMDQSEDSAGQVLPQIKNTSPDTKVKDSNKELNSNSTRSILSLGQTPGPAIVGPTPVLPESNPGTETSVPLPEGLLPVHLGSPPVMIGPNAVPTGTLCIPEEPISVSDVQNQRVTEPIRDLRPINQEDFNENMSTQSDNQSALSSLSSPASSPFIPPSTEPYPPLLPTDLSLSERPNVMGFQHPDQSEDESGSTDQSLCSPWEPRAWPEGRQVLTHLVEGFVIQEGLTPFPVNRSSLLLPDQVSKPQEVNGTNGKVPPVVAVPVSRKRTFTEEEEEEEEVGGDTDDTATKTAPPDRPTLHCQFCGKRGHAHNFMRSKRFCSTSCARGFNVRLTKRLRALSAGNRPERPSLSRAASVPGKPLLLRLPRDLWSAGRREKDRKEKSAPEEEEEEEEEEGDNDGGEEDEEEDEEEEEEEEEQPSVTVTTRSEQQATCRERRASAPAVSATTPTSTFRPTPHQWSVEDVSTFIHTLPGCADVAEAFRLQEIDGQALLLLTEDHLMTSMNIKLGPALKICAHINTLKNQ